MVCSRGVCLLLVTLTGCGISDLDVYRCLEPDKGHKDANGEPDPCHRNDDLAAGEACTGVCLPAPPTEWVGPALVWMGDEAAAPLCPEFASREGVTARRPPAVQPCATTCTCERPSGSCELPATVTASAAICPGNGSGVAQTSFDPPASWSGACTAENAIPAGKLCGGVPCVQSVTVDPLTVKESVCLPVEQPNVPPPPWGTFARACMSSETQPSCALHNEFCVPVAPGPEFKQCVYSRGDPALQHCPPSYPDKSVFYQDFVDNRSCTPCTCGAPEGSTCVGSIGFFSDLSCGAPLLGPPVSIDAVDSKCYDVPLGSALGSKSASEPTYTPGTCPVTGGEKGQIDGIKPLVICCESTL
ncbi:MAG: hypothetical protein ABI134_02245 [Byssovorax sp.]